MLSGVNKMTVPSEPIFLYITQRTFSDQIENICKAFIKMGFVMTHLVNMSDRVYHPLCRRLWVISLIRMIEVGRPDHYR